MVRRLRPWTERRPPKKPVFKRLAGVSTRFTEAAAALPRTGRCRGGPRVRGRRHRTTRGPRQRRRSRIAATAAVVKRDTLVRPPRRRRGLPGVPPERASSACRTATGGRCRRRRAGRRRRGTTDAPRPASRPRRRSCGGTNSCGGHATSSSPGRVLVRSNPSSKSRLTPAVRDSWGGERQHLNNVVPLLGVHVGEDRVVDVQNSRLEVLAVDRRVNESDANGHRPAPVCGGGTAAPPATNLSRAEASSPPTSPAIAAVMRFSRRSS